MKNDLIGCNIKKGLKPGGFTRPFVHKPRKPSIEAVKDAAAAALIRHNVGPTPNAFNYQTELPKR